MATYTSYLNLEKPAVGETFNLLKINQNWDKIDQGVSSLNSNLLPKYPSATLSNKCGTGSVVNCFIVGRVLFVYGYVIAASNMTNNDIIATIEDGYFAYVPRRVWTGAVTTDGTAISVKFDNDTSKALKANSAIASGKTFNFFIAVPWD